MFLKGRSGYTRDGTQWGKGAFLMIFSQDRWKHPEADGRELRACVRTVRLEQCGQFMMGCVMVGPHKITLSGCYGDDGLPGNPDPYPGLWEKLMPLPPELVDEFWKGGGHNTSGSEGPAVQAWAIANEKLLRK
jgi:hypothetical protein